MQTINGKLIIQEQNELTIVKQQNQAVLQQCQNLEVQVSNILQQHGNKCSLEINNFKSQIQTIDKRMISLEQRLLKRYRQMLLTNFCILFGILGLWFWTANNTQPTQNKHKPQKYTELIEIHFSND